MELSSSFLYVKNIFRFHSLQREDMRESLLGLWGHAGASVLHGAKCSLVLVLELRMWLWLQGRGPLWYRIIPPWLTRTGW